MLAAALLRAGRAQARVWRLLAQVLRGAGGQHARADAQVVHATPPEGAADTRGEALPMVVGSAAPGWNALVKWDVGPSGILVGYTRSCSMLNTKLKKQLAAQLLSGGAPRWV